MRKLIAAIGLSLLLSAPAGAAVAFRSIGVKVKGTAANAIGIEPSGDVDNDILVACLFLENETPPALTGPSGWSNTFNGTTMLATLSTAGKRFKLTAWWIRRSGTPALTWTFTSSFSDLTISAYSGAATSGDPWSFGASAVRDDNASATFPALSGTTLDAGEMLSWCGGNWDGGTAGAPPTSFNERADCSGNTSDMEVADLIQAAAGGTGSITGASWTGSVSTAGSLLGGLRPVAAAGGTVCPAPFCGILE